MMNTKYLLIYWTKYDLNFEIFCTHTEVVNFIRAIKKDRANYGKRFNYKVYCGFQCDFDV